MRRKLQGAPPPDIGAVHRHLKDFVPPKEGLRLSLYRSDESGASKTLLRNSQREWAM